MISLFLVKHTFIYINFQLKHHFEPFLLLFFLIRGKKKIDFTSSYLLWVRHTTNQREAKKKKKMFEVSSQVERIKENFPLLKQLKK